MFRFRVFTKKRGDRRTMSDARAHVAQAVIFAAMFVGGGAVLAGVLSRMTIREWRANHEFVETRCRIVAEQIARDEEEGRTKFRPEFTIRYSVGGVDYEVPAFDAARVFFTTEEQCRQALEAFRVGEEYPCWYDPHQPSTAVLQRGYSWYAWVVPLLPAALVGVGFGGLVFSYLTWGKSQEHRSLLQRTNLDLFDPARSVAARYPTVPDDVDVRNSPGTALRYRVPMVPVLGSILSAALAATWNVTVVWFIVRDVRNYFAGVPGDYIYSFLLLPFLAAGGYLAYVAGRQALTTWGMDPTIVEISEHPLTPGGRYELQVGQTGRYQVNALSVSLACDEEATFLQGTNSRAHTQRVVETELFRRGAFSIDRSRPLTERIEFVVPHGAMHSFQSTHNAVKWKIVVRADLHNWPNFAREFAVVVCPGPPGRGP